MSSWQSNFLKLMMRLQSRKLDDLNLRVWNENTSVTAFREYCERGALKARLMAGVEVVPTKIPALPEGLFAEWLEPTIQAKVPKNEEAVIFYCHGGGYISGSCSDHRALVSKLVAYTGIRLLLFEYRLAPEHPFPAAFEDTLAAYRWLLTQIKPNNRIFICGNSAGGGLCLSILLALKDYVSQGESGLRLPCACVSISPNTDMKFTGKPNRVKGSVEPVGLDRMCGKYYIGDNDPCHPNISPLFGDLHGLPPLLIAVGDEEGSLDDSVRFAKKAQAAGVNANLIVGKGQVHCYPLLPDFIPESRQAIKEIATFILEHASSLELE